MNGIARPSVCLSVHPSIYCTAELNVFFPGFLRALFSMMLLDGNKKVPLRPVSFKHDGNRFHCDTTVKFCYSTFYDIRIASSPQRCITNFQIGVEVRGDEGGVA